MKLVEFSLNIIVIIVIKLIYVSVTFCCIFNVSEIGINLILGQCSVQCSVTLKFIAKGISVYFSLV